MTNLTRSFAAALLAGTAMAAPATANTILFSTGTLPNGTPLRPGQPPAGAITVRGGVTQVENGDGEVFSFVGDATFDASMPNVSITDGRVTVSGGRDGAAAFNVGGTIATSVNGQNATASFTVDAGAIAAGRVLGGTVTVTAAGVTRSFDLGQAFAAALGTAPRPVSTAGVARIAAPAAPQGGADRRTVGIDTGQNPSFGALPGGSEAALLGTIITRQNATTAFDFRQVSDPFLNANLASVIYGERLGSLSALIATARALALINGVQGGSTRAADLAYLDALFALFRADGFAAGTPTTTTTGITNYQAAIASSLPTNTTTVATILSTYVGELLAGARNSSSYTTAQLQQMATYLRTAGVPATVDAAARARIDALYAYLDLGGSFGRAPGPLLPTGGPGLRAGAVSSLTAGSYVGSLQTMASGPTTHAAFTAATTFDAAGGPLAIGTVFTRGALIGAESASRPDWMIGRFGENARATYGTAYALARPYAGALPLTGTATYSLLAATTPQYNDGRAVTAASVAATVTARFRSIGPDLTVSGTISTTDSGGVRTYTFTDAQTGASAVVTPTNGNVCGTGSAGCLISPSLTLGGTNGQVIVGTYLISQTGNFPVLGGAWAFGGELPVVAPPPPPPPAVTNSTVAPGVTSRLTSGDYNGAAGGNIFAQSAVTFDAQGAPVTLLPGNFDRGTLRPAESGSGSEWIVGRYGTGRVSFPNGGTAVTTTPEFPGIHFAMMRSLTVALPTAGRAEFALAAWTNPTTASGVTLTDTSIAGRASIAFGSTILWGIDASVNATLGGVARTYLIGSAAQFTTPTGSTEIVNGRLSMRAGVSVTSAGCRPGGCSFTPNFQLGGTQGDLLGGTWALSDNPVLGGPTDVLNGALVFTRTAFTGGSPTPTSTPTPTPTPTPPTVNTNAPTVVAGATGIFDYGGYNSLSGTVAFDATGRLRSFVSPPTATEGGATYTVTRSGATTEVRDTGAADGVIAWTRWANGGVTTSVSTGGSFETPADNGYGRLVFWGTRASALPTSGTATYDLAHGFGIFPFSGTLTGTVTGGRMAVAFGSTTRVGVDLDFTLGTTAYSLKTPDAAINLFPGASAPGVALNADTMRFSTSTRTLGGACTATAVCSGVMQGQLFGVGGTHAAVAFQTPVGTVAVRGAAVFRPAAVATPIPTPTPTPAPTGTGGGTPIVIASSTQASQTATFTTDAAGLASYSVGSSTAATTASRGTTTDRGFTRVGDIIGWTRWAGGTVQRTVGGATGTTAYAENNGELVVWGTRATNLPTSGTATYDLLGASAVTLSTDAAPGTVDSATLNVAFGSAPRVGIDIGVRVGGNDYLLSSSGGAASPVMALDTATMSFGGDLLVSTGNGCAVSTCSGGVQGFLAGAGGSHAGARFTFQTAPGRGQPTAAGVVTFVRRP